MISTLDVQKPFTGRLTPLKSVGIYVLVGGFCTIVFDPLLSALVKNPDNLMQISILKSWFCLILTAGVLYLLVNSSVAALQPSVTASRSRKRQCHATVQNRSEVFWLKDLETNQTIYVSPSYDEIWGKSGESACVSSRFWTDGIHPDDRDRVIIAFEKQLRGEEPFEREYRIVRPDGSVCWIRDRAFPIYNQAGHLYHLAGIAEDITQRKQLEAGLRKLNEELNLTVEQLGEERNQRLQLEEERDQFFLLSLDMLGIAGFDGYFKQLNPAWEKNLGYHQEELLARPYLEWVHPEDRTATMAALRQLTATGTQLLEYENRCRCADGSYKWLSWNATAIKDKQLVYTVARDITDRKQAEANLLQALEKEKELNELKSQIVSVVSHEYRTPLTTILSSAEILERYSHKWSEQKKLQHLNRIQTSAHHLTQLVSDILTLDRAEVGRLEFNPIPLDVVAFCRELVEELQLTIGDKRRLIFINQEECDRRCLDERLLRQILTNLLSNAIKYSYPKSTVDFALVCQQDEVIFRIQDKGIGIPQEDQQHLFESFHRARNVGTIPGTGLGLAIVKKCVDLHGGQIAVESEVGVGTTFAITLPVSV